MTNWNIIYCRPTSNQVGKREGKGNLCSSFSIKIVCQRRIRHEPNSCCSFHAYWICTAAMKILQVKSKPLPQFILVQPLGLWRASKASLQNTNLWQMLLCKTSTSGKFFSAKHHRFIHAERKKNIEGISYQQKKYIDDYFKILKIQNTKEYTRAHTHARTHARAHTHTHKKKSVP